MPWVLELAPLHLPRLSPSRRHWAAGWFSRSSTGTEAYSEEESMVGQMLKSTS